MAQRQSRKNVVNTFLGVMGAAAHSAAIKRFSKKKISFQYFQYNVRKEQKLKRNGEPFIFTPLSLVWNGDYYYVIGVFDHKQKIGNFRVDRIANCPVILNEDATPAPEGFDVTTYLNTTFRMYNSDHSAISKIVFSIGGYFGGYETRTISLDGGDLQVSVQRSLSIEPEEPLAEFILPFDKDEFMDELSRLHIGEWRSSYNPERFGYVVLDGTQWELEMLRLCS